MFVASLIIRTRNMFKKNLVVFCFCLVFILALLVTGGGEVSVVYARSGCCSAHDGVCECECCDGARLSSICQQYYPECAMATNGHDRAHLLPFENGSKWDDRSILNQNEKGNNWSDGWELATIYALSVGLVLFFVKIKYKVKNVRN